MPGSGNLSHMDHTFARRVFLWAGIYGVVVLLPQYFMEGRFAQDFPPPLNHPEHFYGFIGVGLAWQLAFIVISRDPVRFRPLMLPAVVEKFTFAASTFVLFWGGRVAGAIAGAAAVDLLLGVLFLISYVKTASPRTGPR
jgi:hypothetical protein